MLMEQSQEVRGARTVDGQLVPTLKTTIGGGHCSLEVEAGTNGESGGGGSKWGSRTYIRLKNLSSFDILPRANAFKQELEIEIGGDAELQDIQDALLFAARAIKTLRVEAALRKIFAHKFNEYFLDQNDENAVKFWAAESNIDPEHFSPWIDNEEGLGWRQIACGGAHLLFASYDDEFDILKPKTDL